MNKTIIVVVLVIVVGIMGFLVFQKKPCLAGNCENKNEPTPTGTQAVKQYQKVTASEFQSRLTSTSGAVIIDIRTDEEFASGHLTDAINKDFYKRAEFRQYLETLDKDKTYFVYCNSGNRSDSALALFRAADIPNVVEMSGGITAWKAANLPLVK